MSQRNKLQANQITFSARLFMVPFIKKLHRRMSSVCTLWLHEQEQYSDAVILCPATSGGSISSSWWEGSHWGSSSQIYNFVEKNIWNILKPPIRLTFCDSLQAKSTTTSAQKFTVLDSFFGCTAFWGFQAFAGFLLRHQVCFEGSFYGWNHAHIWQAHVWFSLHPIPGIQIY